MGLPTDKFLIMFSGTPRSHKGVDDLARALTQINRPEIKGVVIGAHDSKYIKK
ncbi:hypothetical protein [Natrinema sp. CBA1119]|uniref:hypothetical protein n=1 Tax=Natrinema sp. CBA1119 TaxID=1608465 RepID=UPI003743C577